MNNKPWRQFIPAQVDDLPLTPDERAVYSHLCRRADKEDVCYPSYEAIGEWCFRPEAGPGVNSDSLRRRAMKTVKRLVEHGLVAVEQRRVARNHNMTNYFHILPPERWRIEPRDFSNRQGHKTPFRVTQEPERVTRESAVSDSGVTQKVVH